MSASSLPDAGLDLGRGRVLDTLSHTLVQDGRLVQLSPLASRLLQLLAQRPGEVMERGEIIDALWKGDWLIGDPGLSRLVSEVRSAAKDDAKRPTLIQTVPRRGYRLVTQVIPTGGMQRIEPSWPQIWRLANWSLSILIGGVALLLALAVLARVAR